MSSQKGQAEGVGTSAWEIWTTRFFLNTDGVCADERTVLRIRRMSGTTSLGIDEERQVGAGGSLIGR